MSGDLAILIPAFQPNEALGSLVHELLSHPDLPAGTSIIVVDDGSTNPASRMTFEAIRAKRQVTLLTHPQNRGKGAALKTGFEYVLVHVPGVEYVVTADADGQHLAPDIVKIARETMAKSRFVLGVRQFGRDVPLRSRFGNTLTKYLFEAIFGTRIADTQTGLRGIPRECLPSLLSIKPDRYEFEFEALIQMAKREDVIQIPISTVYEPGNPTSHFDPILDSAKIYAVLVRHVSVVLVIGFIDYITFLTAQHFLSNLFLSLLCARVLSTILYFVAARKIVFRSQGNVYREASLFIFLVAINIALLWPLINFLHYTLDIGYAIAMLFGYLFLFVSNFLWQNTIVFLRSERK